MKIMSTLLRCECLLHKYLADKEVATSLTDFQTP